MNGSMEYPKNVENLSWKGFFFLGQVLNVLSLYCNVSDCIS